MAIAQDVIWRDEQQTVVLSPRAGGRVISWNYQGQERVYRPHLTEGGLLRVLLAEEQYPGSSYVSPHQVIASSSDAGGFRVHLRHHWNAGNWFLRQAHWPEKANELHIDDLVLDKIVTFRSDLSCLLCEISITNVSQERKYLTPWLHLNLSDWPADCFVVMGGSKQEFQDDEIYWGSHLAQAGKPIRLVHAAAGGAVYGVLGAAPEHLRGVAAMMPIAGEFHESTSELRGGHLVLPPGYRWRGNSFFALTDNWQRWAEAAPEPLASVIEPAGPADDAGDYAAVLESWMLPEEHSRGLMVLSFLDKAPFSSGARYGGNHSFAGFHAESAANSPAAGGTAGGGGAAAHVALYACREIGVLAAELSGPAGWAISLGGAARGRSAHCQLPVQQLTRLILHGPADLADKQSVAVTLRLADGSTLILKVAQQAAVEPERAYQVRQTPVYLAQRYQQRCGPASEAPAQQIRQWQNQTREKCRQWLSFQADGPCPLEPRLTERQEGPTCIREKWLIQTERGIWAPSYLVRPKTMTGRRPLLFQLHGSGLGKDGFAPDEGQTPPTQLGHELEMLPYRLAVLLNCQVFVPDGRGQGEMGETNPAQWQTRMEAMGLSCSMLRVHDQIRSLDWLVQRDDVDGARVGSFGCSGGGNLTYWFAALDERIAAAIVSSSGISAPLRPLPDGYFHQEFVGKDVTIDPSGPAPVSGAPAGFLVAPRPMWIMDGSGDLGIADSQRAAWRQQMQAGRDAIRAIYRRLGVEDRFEDTWFDGGHCAGSTLANVATWFSRWFGL